MAATRAQRSQQARIAALTRSSQETGAAMTAAARSAFLDRFYRQTDENLPEEERQRQAQAALRAHMSRIRRGKRRTSTEIAADIAADIAGIRAVAEEARAEISEIVEAAEHRLAARANTV